MQEACQAPASCSDTNLRHPTSVHSGTPLHLSPDKSQTPILPSFVSYLQLFHPKAGAFLGPRSWGCPKASRMGSRRAASARGRLHALPPCLRGGRGGWPVLDYARPPADLNGQARARHFSEHLGKGYSGKKNPFTLPITTECKGVWATPGLPGPCPPQGFGLRF